MVTPAHAEQVVDVCCKAEAAKDRDGAGRMLAPIVDHLVFDDAGLIVSRRAFFDPAGVRPGPE